MRKASRSEAAVARRSARAYRRWAKATLHNRIANAAVHFNLNGKVHSVVLEVREATLVAVTGNLLNQKFITGTLRQMNGKPTSTGKALAVLASQVATVSLYSN